MKQSADSAVCNRSARHVKNLLDKGILTTEQTKADMAHANSVIFSTKTKKIAAYLLLSQKTDCKRSRAFDNLNIITQQRCANPKDISHFFPVICKYLYTALTGRINFCQFREYFFAVKFKHLASQSRLPNPKKYQIDLLKEQPEMEGFLESSQDWMPLKMEERHFLMGHTMKSPSP